MTKGKAKKAGKAKRAWQPSLSPETRAKLEEFDGTFDGTGLYWDREGDRMSLADWAEAFEDREYCFIAQTKVDQWLISTVWIGTDARGGPAPRIFETMVFDNSPEGISEDQEVLDRVGSRMKAVLGPEAYEQRWATEAEALEGHRQAVVAAEAGLIRRTPEL